MSSEPLIRRLPRQKIGPHDTALVVIDMERDFIDEGAVQETPGGRALIPTINLLATWARAHGLPVIFTHEMHRADHSDYGIELEYDPVHCLEVSWRRGSSLRRATIGFLASGGTTLSSARISTCCCARRRSKI
jgi:hypothetical protein